MQIRNLREIAIRAVAPKEVVMSVIDATRMPLDLSSEKSVLSTSEQPGTIEFEMQEQCHSNWCWAAVAASVAAYYDRGSEVRQCDMANLELDRADCCHSACGAKDVDFNVTNVLASPLNRVRCLERLARRKRATPAEVLEELEAGRPLCVRTVWRDGGAHFVAIVGYWPDTEETGTLALEDPFWGASEYSYAGFADHYQLLGGRWTDTYYTKSPSA
jgi:Papain-like cysteine protease AvrRpt2